MRRCCWAPFGTACSCISGTTAWARHWPPSRVRACGGLACPPQQRLWVPAHRCCCCCRAAAVSLPRPPRLPRLPLPLPLQSSITTPFPTCAPSAAAGTSTARSACCTRRQTRCWKRAWSPRFPPPPPSAAALTRPSLAAGLVLPVAHHRDPAPRGAAAPAAPHRRRAQLPARHRLRPRRRHRGPPPHAAAGQAGRGGACQAVGHGGVRGRRWLAAAVQWHCMQPQQQM